MRHLLCGITDAFNNCRKLPDVNVQNSLSQMNSKIKFLYFKAHFHTYALLKSLSLMFLYAAYSMLMTTQLLRSTSHQHKKGYRHKLSDTDESVMT